MPEPVPPASSSAVRVAAAGDIHCRAATRDSVLEAFSSLDGEADLVLLAGDLTGEGEVEEAEILCEAVSGTSLPVFAVLGNHDWHAGNAAEIADRLRAAEVTLLEGGASRLEVGGIEVGVAGAKGFVGGFAPSQMPDFGEPSLRAVYAETGEEVAGLDAGLREIATCAIRLVVLHYSPVQATLEGEPPEIFAFLGSDRLAAPILEHGPDLVVHGHAHAGAAAGQIGDSPVHNVSQTVIGREFQVFELAAELEQGPIR
ncbi:MAG TPA: metallophosphoesterase [Solirubrobacterales bacterium]|jgi:Icc-related predicted phosphoesterase